MNELMKKLFMEQLYQVYLNNGVKDVEKTEESLILNINKLAVPFETYLDKNGNPRKFIPLPVKELAFKIIYPDGIIEANPKLVRIAMREYKTWQMACRCEVCIYQNLEEKERGLYIVKHGKDFLLDELYNKMKGSNNFGTTFEALRPYASSITTSHALTKLGIGLGVDSVEEDMDLATAPTENDDFTPTEEILDTKAETDTLDLDKFYEGFETETEIATTTKTEEVKEEVAQEQEAVEETTPVEQTEEKPKKRGRKPKAVSVEESIADTTTTADEPAEADLETNAVAEKVVSEEVISNVEEVAMTEAVIEETVEETAIEEAVVEETAVEEISVEQPAVEVSFPTDDGVQTSFDFDGNIDVKEETPVVDEEETIEMTLEEAKNHKVEVGKHTYDEVIPSLWEIAEKDPANFNYFFTERGFNNHSKRGQVALRLIAENTEELRYLLEKLERTEE